MQPSQPGFFNEVDASPGGLHVVGEFFQQSEAEIACLLAHRKTASRFNDLSQALIDSSQLLVCRLYFKRARCHLVFKVELVFPVFAQQPDAFKRIFHGMQNNSHVFNRL